MKAYVSAPLGVPGATSGSMFSPVQVELVAAEPEVAGLDLLYKTKYSKVGYARYGLRKLYCLSRSELWSQCQSCRKFLKPVVEFR